MSFPTSQIPFVYALHVVSGAQSESLPTLSRAELIDTVH